MDAKPLVSVIIPVYNTEKYLKQCIESVINQTYSNLEIIIVDDGSTDSSPQICDEYAKKDKRITVIHKENGGLSSTRNIGMEIITGEYFAFVDSDDFILNNCIEKLCNMITANKSDIVSCGFIKDRNSISKASYTKNKTVSAENLLIDFFYRKIDFASCCGKLYKNNLRIIKNKNVIFVEDQIFNTECLLISNNVSFVRDRLYYYRYNENSIMHNSNEAQKYYLALKTSYEYFKGLLSNPIFNKAVKCLLISYSFFVLLNIINCDYKEEQLEYCTKIIKKYRKDVLFDYKASIKTRGACLLSFFGIKCLSLFYKLL